MGSSWKGTLWKSALNTRRPLQSPRARGGPTATGQQPAPLTQGLTACFTGGSGSGGQRAPGRGWCCGVCSEQELEAGCSRFPRVTWFLLQTPLWGACSTVCKAQAPLCMNWTRKGLGHSCLSYKV